MIGRSGDKLRDVDPGDGGTGIGGGGRIIDEKDRTAKKKPAQFLEVIIDFGTFERWCASKNNEACAVRDCAAPGLWRLRFAARSHR